MKTLIPLYVTISMFALPTIGFGDVQDLNALKNGCDQDDFNACGDLSKAELDSNQRDNAQLHAHKACDGGNLRGCTVLGILLRTGGDSKEAKVVLKKACDGNYLKGCVQLGATLDEQGRKIEAKDIFKKVCQSKEPAGCFGLAFYERTLGNKDEALRLFKSACDSGMKDSCDEAKKTEADSGIPAHCDSGDANCLSNRERRLSAACDLGGYSQCYEYGKIREERHDQRTLILQVYQSGCDGGNKESCDAIKRVLTDSCIYNETHSHKECYPSFDQMAKMPIQSSGGTTVVNVERFDNPECNKKLEFAKKADHCAVIGDFEAKNGAFAEAEKIYSAGCTSPSNNQGCGGLVCLGAMKAATGNKQEAFKLFKQACINSAKGDGSYDGKAYNGCLAANISLGPIEADNKKSIAKASASKIGKMTDTVKSCQAEWDKAWGPRASKQ